jgi:hypothetical protein
VDKPGFVHVLKPQSRLANVVSRTLRRQWPFPLQNLVECRPFHILHDQEVQIAYVVNVVSPHNVGMVECGNGSTLAIESLHRLRIGRFFRGKHFDGNPSLQ